MGTGKTLVKKQFILSHLMGELMTSVNDQIRRESLKRR
jgi:hypothetical protein